MEGSGAGASWSDESVSWIEEELVPNGAPSSRVGHLLRAIAKASPAKRLLIVLPGWIVAAVLTELAPFQPLVTVIAVGRGAPITALDGWGRTPPDLVTITPQGANFGIALSGCAACLIVLVLAVTIANLAPTAHRGVAVLSHGMAIAAPCLLVGVTGSLLLYINAYLDELRRIGFARPPTPPDSRGPCLWLALAAIVAAAMSTTLYFATSPEIRRPSVDA